MSTGMVASELEMLLVSQLVREVGGTAQSWRKAVGTVIVRDRKTHAHCNWELRPGGTQAQRAAIELLLDDIRLRYPLVAEG